MELAVYNSKGDKTGKTVSLDEGIFGIEPNDHVIWLDVKRYRNAQRQGTHKSKERGEIAGSTRKIKKQKGTGTARAGSIKNPLFKGGGRVFGPRPRSYDIKLNKNIGTARTRDFVQVLKNLKVDGQKTTFVMSEKNEMVYLSSRNVQSHQVRLATDLNTYDILNCDKIVFVGNAHEVVSETLNK
jgi:large subunit ribosomal protein L4